MLGVIIHGATRNVTVSVKMGVSGMPWPWERRGTPQSHTGWVRAGPVSLFVGETNSDTFTEHLLYAGNCAKCRCYMLVWGCVCTCLCRCVCKCPRWPEEGLRAPGARVTCRCEGLENELCSPGRAPSALNCQAIFLAP